jgi:HEPN domain-containing protein
MDLQSHIAYWMESAKHDLDTAETLFRSEKYTWCLFLGHLVLEKALKAIFVIDNDNAHPPRTHNLVKLMQVSSIQVKDDVYIWLDEVNDFHLETRYPDFKRSFFKKCTRPFAEYHLNKIRETFLWIESQMKLRL